LAAGPGKNGRILMRPFVVTGDLGLNAKTKGKIQIEVSHSEDKPLPGRSAQDGTPFTDNHLRAKIVWGQRSLAGLHGKTARLRFLLDRASLDSFTIDQSVGF